MTESLDFQAYFKLVNIKNTSTMMTNMLKIKK